MKLKGSDFVDIYIDWLKSNIKFNEIGEYTEIDTPFLDRHNDHLQIYVKQNNGRLLLTDDGYILGDLAVTGCDVNSNRRRIVLETILNSAGVKIGKNDELFVEATLDSFAQKKHMLIQAMLSVNDMFMLSQHRVMSLFLEDVETYLSQNDIRSTPNALFTGKSGFTHTVDFVIPSSKQRPERLIKAVNNPTKDKAKSVLFAWTDIAQVRKGQPAMYIFLNDADKEIRPEVMNAFSEYDVNTVLWSQRERYVDELAS